MNPLKKKFFLLFLIIYLLAGSINSVKTGISFDENYEELNWNFNVKVLYNLKESFISKKKFDRQQFDKEVKNFVGYGIGFQILSQPIQSVIKGGIIAGDIDLEKPSASNVFKRQETNSKLQSIGSTISKMNEKMKEKQNLVF